jgi:uncharacterized protein with GYD domain
MTNSLYETISSTLKEHPIIFGIICTAISIFISLEILLVLGKGIHSELITYPLFAGAIFSWAFAVLATGIILIVAFFIRNKKDLFKYVLEKSKKLLIGISIVVIFYISINLASEALTGAGVPILSEPYQILIFTNVTYQDVILISLVFLIIFLLFLVAPLYNKNRRLIFAFVIVGLIIVILVIPPFAFHCHKKDIPETYSFSWNCVPGDNDEKLRNFLKDVFDIDWAKNAEICKFNGGMTISITQDENSAEIMMDATKEKAILNFSDGRTYELKVRPENDKLYIYSDYLFSWDSVPGDDEEKFKGFLRDDFDIDWTENAEICNDGMTISITQDERSAEIIMGEKKEKAILKIRDGRTHELKVKTENGELNIYYPETTQKGKSEQILPFLFFLVVSLLILFLLWRIMPKEAAKDDNLRDLLFYFSIIPALIVASLVLIEHNLVTYPNFTGHVVVGFLFISGFATLVILTMIALKDVKNGLWIWGFTVAASLAAISGFSALLLFLEGFIHEIGTFRKFLMFSIVILLVILQYSFAYEKLLKYGFTEWWRREWRPIAMIIAILVILIVIAINPEHEFRLLGIVIALIIVLSLPWILGWLRFRKEREPGEYKRLRFKPPKFMPEYQGMVLVKADPGSLKKVVNELDGMKGVYQTMVVRGEYDVCLIVEGVSSDALTKKILKITKIDGIASTTTLTDIREFFDREVR